MKQEVIRKEWLRKIRRRDYFYKPSENIHVCSKHFKNSDFRINQANNHRLLKCDVVPTLFTWDFSTESDSSHDAQSMFTESSIKKHQDSSLDDTADSGEYSNEFRDSNKVPNGGHNPTPQELFKWTCRAMPMPSTFEHDLSNARFQLENPGMDTNLFVSSDVIVPTLLTSIKKEPGIESDDTCDNESNNAFDISGTGTGTSIKDEPETIISDELERRNVDEPDIYIKTELETCSEDEMDTCIDDEPQTCIKDGKETSMEDEPGTFTNATVNSNADCSSVVSDEKSVAIKLKLNMENKKLKDMVKELESQIALQKIKLLMKEVELSNLKKQLETEITLSMELEKQIEEQSACTTNQESS